MFLECRTDMVDVPKSNDVSLVFPFQQWACKFKRNTYDEKYIDETRFTKKQMEEFIDDIESKCGYFKPFKKYQHIAIATTVLFAIAIIVGNVLLNIGLAEKRSADVVEVAKFEDNSFVAAGASILGVGSGQFVAVLIFLALKMRKTRRYYENITLQLINTQNAAWKAVDVRWKLGRRLAWIELSLDYKLNDALTDNKTFTPLFLGKMSSLEVGESVRTYI